MDLREYMFKERLKNHEMAEILDCSVPQIILVRRGHHVSKKFARQIERATNGKVKASEVVTKVIPLPAPEPQYHEEEEKKSA